MTLTGSSPNGNIGISMYSHDNADTIHQTNCLSGVAPLERIGIAVSIDKTTHTQSMHTFGRTGNFDSSFVGVLSLITETLPSEEDIELLATPVADSMVDNDTDQVNVNIIYRVPESLAGKTVYITIVFKFSYEVPPADPVIGYVVIPTSLTVMDFEDAGGADKISLVSILDQDGNNVANGVCVDLGITELVTYTFQYDDPNPENYSFIPLISEEVIGDNRWQEENPYPNANFAQLDSDYIVAADSDFTGGTAQVTIDIRLLPISNYCVSAIAKHNTLTAPDVGACVAMTVHVQISHFYWTDFGFNLLVDLIDFILPAGYSMGTPKVFMTVKNGAQIYLDTEMTGIGGLVGQITDKEFLIVDNDPGQGLSRVHDNIYEVSFTFEIQLTDTTTMETCSYLPDGSVVMQIPTPAVGAALDSYNGTIGPTSFNLRAI